MDIAVTNLFNQLSLFEQPSEESVRHLAVKEHRFWILPEEGAGSGLLWLLNVLSYPPYIIVWVYVTIGNIYLLIYNPIRDAIFDIVLAIIEGLGLPSELYPYPALWYPDAKVLPAVPPIPIFAIDWHTPVQFNHYYGFGWFPWTWGVFGSFVGSVWEKFGFILPYIWGATYGDVQMPAIWDKLGAALDKIWGVYFDWAMWFLWDYVLGVFDSLLGTWLLYIIPIIICAFLTVAAVFVAIAYTMGNFWIALGATLGLTFANIGMTLASLAVSIAETVASVFVTIFVSFLTPLIFWIIFILFPSDESEWGNYQE